MRRCVMPIIPIDPAIAAISRNPPTNLVRKRVSLSLMFWTDCSLLVQSAAHLRPQTRLLADDHKRHFHRCKDPATAKTRRRQEIFLTPSSSILYCCNRRLAHATVAGWRAGFGSYENASLSPSRSAVALPPFVSLPKRTWSASSRAISFSIKRPSGRAPKRGS